MPIGAIAGATAVAGIGSSIIGSHAQSSAADSAAATAASNTQANNALSREMYATNEAHLQPWENVGHAATDELMGLLLGDAPATPSTGAGTWTGPTPTGASTSALAGTDGIPGYFGPSMAEISAMQHDGIKKNYQAALATYNQAKQAAAHATPAPATTPTTPATTPTTPAATTGTTGQSALSAFDKFRDSTDYKFRFNQGQEAVDTGAAARGSLDSGATRKAEITYGNNVAAGALGDYMDRLYQQEAIGTTASSALAGVGTNLVGQVTANNNAAASTAANAALASGNASANMWNGIGSSVGNAAGYIAANLPNAGGGGSALGNVNFANTPVNLNGPGYFY